MKDTVEHAATLLVKKLKAGRKDGTITPATPIRGKALAKAWNEKFIDDVSDVDVREWANYARGVLGQPIYSDSNGYAWCTTKQEWDRTKAHLLSRIKKIQAAATKPDYYWEHINQERVFSDDDRNGQCEAATDPPNEAISTGSPALDAFLTEAGATEVTDTGFDPD